MSGDMADWFHESRVVTHLQAENAGAAITELGMLLQEGGFVKESFVPAVIERERGCATGLPTSQFGVAIPHTDCEHVLKRAVAVGILDRPVEFTEMASPGTTVQVSIVFLLAVPEPEGAVRLLQSLALMFETPGVLEQLIRSRDASEIVNVIRRHCPGLD